MKNYKIVLASGSPRRRELMDLVGAEYIVIPSDKEEDMSEHDPSLLVKGLSQMKAIDVSEKIIEKLKNSELSDDYRNCVIIGCDTIVAINGKILGKPHTDEVAYSMISEIQGKTHDVYTGVCILKITDSKIEQNLNYSVRSGVSVAPMIDSEIKKYVATGESRDKAGAYAIQGLFCPFIEGINGDYYNIVGFPISSIYTSLKELGVNLF